MRQNGTVAYMSKPCDGPIFYEGDTLCYADGRTFAAPYAVSLADQERAAWAADREVRAILAETERAERNACDTGHRSADSLEVNLYGDALAASLAAILPVLDELEREAGR